MPEAWRAAGVASRAGRPLRTIVLQDEAKAAVVRIETTSGDDVIAKRAVWPSIRAEAYVYGWLDGAVPSTDTECSFFGFTVTVPAPGAAS